MSTARQPRATGLAVGLVLGLPVMAYGVSGLFHDAARTRPAALVQWVIGSAVVHDLVVAPLALVVVAAVTGFGRARPRRWLLWALATSALLVVFSWPLVRGYGRNATVPSLLPRDYTTGLLVYLAAVWLVALTVAAVARRARRRSGPSTGPIGSRSSAPREGGG